MKDKTAPRARILYEKQPESRGGRRAKRRNNQRKQVEEESTEPVDVTAIIM